jgi:hypothetical protein
VIKKQMAKRDPYSILALMPSGPGAFFLFSFSSCFMTVWGVIWFFGVSGGVLMNVDKS